MNNNIDVQYCDFRVYCSGDGNTVQIQFFGDGCVCVSIMKS